MYLSARSRIILEKILPTKQELTVPELASQLNVSERTVRRDLEEVKQILTQFDLSLDKKGGKLSIVGSDLNRETMMHSLLDLVSQEFTPFERKQHLLQILLRNTEPVKLISLANELAVTVATISNDLSKLEEDWNGKILIQRKRGIGVVLEATTAARRELIRELILSSVPKIKLQKFFSQPGNSEELLQDFPFLSDFIDLSEVADADYALTRWMKKLSYEIKNDSYVHLLLYLLLAMKQIAACEFIAKKSDNPIFLQDYPEYDIAARILQDVVPEVKIPETEITEMTMQILESEIQTGEAVFYRNEKVQAIRIAKKLITRVTKEMDLPLSQLTLLKGLTEHIQYSLIRLKKNMPLSNPLLALIRNEFGTLFDTVHRIASELYPFEKLPEEETGFIVLHFEAAVIQSENLRPYSALVVTSRSNGVSTWLKAKFKKQLPKLTKIKFVTPLELVKETDFAKYDIILSTTELSDFGFDYEWISIFISDEEIASIEQKLEKKVSAEKSNPLSLTSQFDLDLSKTVSDLKNAHFYYGLVISFLESLSIEGASGMTRNVEDNLRNFSQQIAEKHRGIETEGLFQKLDALEAKQKMILGGTSTGIFVVNENVDHASAHIFTLTHLIDFQIEAGIKTGVSTVMVILLPYELSAEELEIVTYLLNVLTEDDALILLAESGDKKKIESLFAISLREFLAQKNPYSENGYPFLP